jgi:hypothetical protein
MAVIESADREIVEYLRFLTEHGSSCKSAACPSCQTLQNICELVTSLLFSNECYAEVRISEGARHSTAGVD